MAAVITPERLDRFVRVVRSHPRCTAEDYAAIGGVSYAHASKLLRTLYRLRRIRREKAPPRDVPGARHYLYF